MICEKCGHDFEGNFCGSCVAYRKSGSGYKSEEPVKSTSQSPQNCCGMKCPRCGCHNITIQAVTEVKTKTRGCFSWLCWILLAMCTLGLIIIIPLITNSKTKTKVRSEAICQTCGNHWRI